MSGVASGLLARFAGSMTGGLYTDDGEALPGVAPDLNAMVAAAPFRSILTAQWPAEIGTVWIVPDDDPFPPPFILQAMAEEFAGGRAVMILATNRAARNRAKVVIAMMLAPSAEGRT